MTARPLRADAARNRQLLLDAAREALGAHGVTASSTMWHAPPGSGPNPSTGISRPAINWCWK